VSGGGGGVFLLCRTNNKNYFLSPELAKPAKQAAGGAEAAPSIFFITFWAFSYILFVRVCVSAGNKKFIPHMYDE